MSGKIAVKLSLLLLILLSSCSKWDHPSYWVRTEDGCRLPVFTYSGKSTMPAIIYLHGLGANHNNFDAYPPSSFARFFSRKGYQGFSFDFRGHGGAICRDKSKIKIGRLWRYDLPAVIRSVKKRKIKRYFLMGHSLGGITLLEYAAHFTDPSLISIIAIGAPVTFTSSQRKIFLPLINRIDFLKRISPYLWSYPFNYLIDAEPVIKFALRHIKLIRLLGNPDNLDPEQVKVMLTRAVSPSTPISIIDQLKEAIINGPLVDEMGINYLTSLEKIKVPVLFIAGSTDMMARPKAVIMSYRETKALAKLIIAGKKYGFSIDYGHIDLVVGKRAPSEILPIIYNWIKRYSDGGGDRIRTGE